MPSKKAPKSAVEASDRALKFLETTSVRPARACATCLHPRRAEIDADLRLFVEHRIARTTYLSLAAYVDRFLRSEYGYNHSAKAAERHLRNCLALEIPPG